MSHSQRINSDLVVQDGLPQMRRETGRITKTPAGLWEKTAQVVKKILIGLFVIGGTVIGNICTLGIPTIMSLLSRMDMKVVKEDIEAKRIHHLHSALMCGLTGDRKWKPQISEVSVTQLLGVSELPNEDTDYFVSEVVQLRDWISDLEADRRENRVQLGSVEEVYKQLQSLGNNIRFISIFHELEKTEHPSVNFLKILSAKFRSAKMSDVLIQYAEEKLGPVQPDQGTGYSVGKTGEVIAEFRKEPSFKQNFIWAISHPFGWFHSCESKWLQKKYDNNESNPTYTVHEISYRTRNNKTLTTRFTAGPTPFNDAAYQNIFLTHGHELRYNIMDTSKAEEHGWIRKMDEAASKSKGHMEHVVLGFVTKEKRGYLESSELDPLIDGYQDALLMGNACRTIQPRKTDNGVVIPEKLLSDEQIKNACSTAKALVKELNPDLSKKEARHAVLVTVDTMMALGTTINYLEKLQGVIEDLSVDEDMRSVYIAAACKQCYDRGPVYLAALLIFLRSLNNSDPLTKEEFYKISGLPIFRAPLSEGREQQEEKFAVYEALAKMLGSRMDVLSKHTRAFSSTLG